MTPYGSSPWRLDAITRQYDRVARKGSQLSEEPRAVIVGASVAGLASACAVAQSGWQVTLLERRENLADGGRALLLQPNGLAALKRLGALEGVRKRGIEVGRVLMYERGLLAARFDYRELGHPQASSIEIRPQAVRTALAERAVRLGVSSPRFGAQVAELSSDSGSIVGVRCADGSEIEADLIIGADGRDSLVRERLGISTRRAGTASGYLLGTVDLARRNPDIQLHCGNGYANGVCPLPDGTYFWDCITDQNRPAVEAHDLSAWREIYRQRVPCADDFIESIREWGELWEVEVRPFWAARRQAGNAVLVGDAAGMVHPHAAQGANLALEDAAELGQALVPAARPAVSLPEQLRCFARTRDRKLRRYVLWSLAAAASLDGSGPLSRVVRQQSFRGSRIRPLRRLVVRQQAGLI
jgi:2-polyprenyl-6-methoxyphenol hydroxylase-like FAD-dependent oxidoreductase